MLEQLSKTDIDILYTLAVKKETSRYELKDITNRAYSGIHRSISKLLSMKLIYETRTEPNKKNRNVEVKYYSLTNIGLFNTLGLVKTWENIDLVANTHPEKYPLIFGKWGFFKENGILELIVERLFNGVYMGLHILGNTPYEDIDYLESENTVLDEFSNEFIKEIKRRFIRNRNIIRPKPEIALTQAVFGIHEFPKTTIKSMSFKELNKIWNVCKQDTELRNYYLQENSDEIKSGERDLINLHFWENIFLNS